MTYPVLNGVVQLHLKTTSNLCQMLSSMHIAFSVSKRGNDSLDLEEFTHKGKKLRSFSKILVILR